MYSDALAGIPGVRFLGITGEGRDDAEDNCWLTCIEIDPDIGGTTPARLIAALAEQDIESRHLWKPMHLQPIFASRRAFVSGVSERLFDRGIALPSGSALRDDEIERVISVLLGELGQR
jgi:dTDP-4-amino-4,6-dideoxygalactose transaminase